MAKAEIKNRIRALRFQHGEMLALAFRIARTFGMTVEDVFEWKE
jgi:hypothetical protein